MTFVTSRNPPQNHEEWLQLLQKQESLHNIEAQKWQRLLKNAIEYLRQVNILLIFEFIFCVIVFGNKIKFIILTIENDSSTYLHT